MDLRHLEELLDAGRDASGQQVGVAGDTELPVDRLDHAAGKALYHPIAADAPKIEVLFVDLLLRAHNRSMRRSTAPAATWKTASRNASSISLPIALRRQP